MNLSNLTQLAAGLSSAIIATVGGLLFGGPWALLMLKFLGLAF